MYVPILLCTQHTYMSPYYVCPHFTILNTNASNGNTVRSTNFITIQQTTSHWYTVRHTCNTPATPPPILANTLAAISVTCSPNCNTLHHTATHYNTPATPPPILANTLAAISVTCSPNCNTLHHTATHYNKSAPSQHTGSEVRRKSPFISFFKVIPRPLCW